VRRKSFEDDAHGMPSRLHSCPDCRTRCMRPELDQQYKRHCSVRISACSPSIHSSTGLVSRLDREVSGA
jgi:hypothetical protein